MKLLPSAFRIARHDGRMMIELSAFENRRSFTSSANLRQAGDGLPAGTAPSGVYLMADDEPLSTNALIALMAASLGRRPRIWRLPPGLVRRCARIGDWMRLPLNTERLEKLTESYVVSNARLRKALGLERFSVTAENGLRMTLESFGNKCLRGWGWGIVHWQPDRRM